MISACYIYDKHTSCQKNTTFSFRPFSFNYTRPLTGFGLYFEAKVATELSEFLQRYDKNSDGIWIATVNGRVEGSVIIDGIHTENEGAHLRWFIISDTLRGKGVGRKLINRAIDFCKSKGYKTIYLWTFEGLDAARHLYEEVGFKLIKQKSGVQWGAEVTEQYFELRNE